MFLLLAPSGRRSNRLFSTLQIVTAPPVTAKLNLTAGFPYSASPTFDEVCSSSDASQAEGSSMAMDEMEEQEHPLLLGRRNCRSDVESRFITAGRENRLS